MINLQMLIQCYIQCFKFMLSFWKNMLSNVCLGFFGADAILANAKAWDLVLWKCPRRSTTLRSHSICFNFSYLHWEVNTFKTPEMCLYLYSDVWAGWFTIIVAWSFHYFEPVSCRILVCQNVTGIPRPFDQLPTRMGKAGCQVPIFSYFFLFFGLPPIFSYFFMKFLVFPFFLGFY